MNAVKEGSLVRGAERAALSTGAVVSIEIDDQRVVELTHVLNGLNNATDLMIDIGLVGGEYLHLPDEQLLFDIAQLVPGLEHFVGPWLELGVGRNHTEFLLVGEDRLAQLLVALVEEMHALDLLDPLLGRVVRSMGRPGGVLYEKRLVGTDLVEPVQIVDGVVGHAGDQVPARLACKRVDLGGVAKQVRLPLVGVAADETIEVFEAHARGPLVEGAGLTGSEGGDVMVLAEPRGGVTILQEDASNGRFVFRDDAVVAGETGGLLRDYAETHRVMVAAGDQRRPGR